MEPTPTASSRSPGPTGQKGPGARRSLRPDDGRLLRGRRSRDRIREAARALFRERGFDETTLRMIAERCGMGASSIYRHIRAKEELLVDELAELQEQAWTRLRTEGDGRAPTRERMRAFLDAEHELLARDPDYTLVALRATTHPGARVAKQALALQDRTVGLLAEILMAGRARGELRRDVDAIVAAQAIGHMTSGARIAWANGMISADECGAAVHTAVGLLFQGLEVARSRSDPPEEGA